MKIRCTVYWIKTDNPSSSDNIEKIRKRFNIPHYTTVNGESPVEVDEEEMKLLKECQRLGFIQIRNRKWEKKGDLYIFIYR